LKTIKKLKAFLKPPFVYDGGDRITDSTGILMTVFGERFVEQKYLFDEFTSFITTAMNEAWRKNCGEPMRWKYGKPKGIFEFIICPKCKFEYEFFKYNYCPHCGQRLLLPKGRKPQ